MSFFTVITMGKNTNLIDVIHAKFLIQFLPHASMAYLMMKLFSTLCLTNSLSATIGRTACGEREMVISGSDAPATNQLTIPL
jgi:hypothetical protein